MDTTIINTLLTKESIFTVLFVFMLFRQIKHSEEQEVRSRDREEKLTTFLNDMKNEFANLVKQYERLSEDVEDIKNHIDKDDKKGSD
ncbi:BhlA/UviB family holin-like peptide [Priestia megaterium]